MHKCNNGRFSAQYRIADQWALTTPARRPIKDSGCRHDRTDRRPDSSLLLPHLRLPCWQSRIFAGSAERSRLGLTAFGGWRGFVQVKAINYNGKDSISLQGGPFSNTDTQVGGPTQVASGSDTTTIVRRVSTKSVEFTAGVTVPLGVAFNFWRQLI
jgi:hypothetical protein